MTRLTADSHARHVRDRFLQELTKHDPEAAVALGFPEYVGSNHAVAVIDDDTGVIYEFVPWTRKRAIVVYHDDPFGIPDAPDSRVRLLDGTVEEQAAQAADTEGYPR